MAISDERLHAFMRVHVLGIANDTDNKTLDELRLDDGEGVFTLYLRARDHYQAIITFTSDGATILSGTVRSSV